MCQNTVGDTNLAMILKDKALLVTRLDLLVNNFYSYKSREDLGVRMCQCKCRLKEQVERAVRKAVPNGDSLCR